MSDAVPASAPEVGHRRAVIIAAAARMFYARGYAATTVRDLAREVGLTSGSIFYHFASKEEILICVVEEGLRQTKNRINEILLGTKDPVQRLKAMIGAHLSVLLEGSPEPTSVVFSERWAISPQTRERLVDMRDSYEELWDDALAAAGGIFADPAQRRLIRLLLLGSMNWSVQWFSPTGDFSIDDIAAVLTERFVRQQNPEAT